jgi:hypothetical protein
MVWHKSQSGHQLWEEGSHPQRVESEGVMRQKLEYIHHHPVKRGFVDLPEHWRWSSARDDAGLAGWIGNGDGIGRPAKQSFPNRVPKRSLGTR